MDADITMESRIQKNKIKPCEQIGELGYREGVKLVVDALSLFPNLRVLDMHFGEHPLVSFLFKESSIQYFGFETSMKCIEKGKRIYKYYIRQRKAYFGDFDGLHIPYVANFFHRVLSVHPRIDSTYRDAYLQEIYRVLAPGGILVFVCKIHNYKECLHIMEQIKLCCFTIDDLKVLQLNLNQESLELHKSAFFIVSKAAGPSRTDEEDS